MQLVFNGLEIHKDRVPNLPFEIQAAWTLQNNPWKKVAIVLNELKYSAEQCRNISFLIRMKQECVDEDLDAIYELKKYQSRHQIDSSLDLWSWASITGLDERSVGTFFSFNLCKSVSEVPGTAGLQGADIGKRMREFEIERLRQYRDENYGKPRMKRKRAPKL